VVLLLYSEQPGACGLSRHKIAMLMLSRDPIAPPSAATGDDCIHGSAAGLRLRCASFQRATAVIEFGSPAM
jgi:hypothetical protein